MDTEHRYSDHRLCEKTLNRVRGVANAKLVVNAGEIEEIHVLAQGDRDSKLLVRDILSALFTCHDVHLKPDQIKVVENQGSVQLTRGNERARLLGLNYHLSEGWGRAGVQLEFSGERYHGMAEGPSTMANRSRLFADATLQAVQSCLDDLLVLTAEHVAIIDMGFDRAVLVAVAVGGTKEDEVLTGSCIVRGDEWEAVVKATLQALNRRFTAIG